MSGCVNFEGIKGRKIINAWKLFSLSTQFQKFIFALKIEKIRMNFRLPSNYQIKKNSNWGRENYDEQPNKFFISDKFGYSNVIEAINPENQTNYQQ